MSAVSSEETDADVLLMCQSLELSGRENIA